MARLPGEDRSCNPRYAECISKVLRERKKSVLKEVEYEENKTQWRATARLVFTQNVCTIVVVMWEGAVDLFQQNN